MSDAPVQSHMTRQELRVFLHGWFCDCGDPEAASAELLDLLRRHPLHEDERWKTLEEDLGTSGRFYLVLYTLDHFDLTEHGGSIGGGWLTEKGKAVMNALEAEEADDFEALFADHCAAGRDLDDPGHRADIPEGERCPCRKTISR